ncbi:rod shape-determining protein MreD [Candidatus Schneideria nysicola]|uniref:rod shape-determining protein MreD n=1 Tax=Candidatus Schneideria nysicola TaxID=1081631 RepID=UPI001CAA5B21|nr:rod shape-determining protein MreD [Candidatus Schneideria nysicola]UAJ65626.1 rod shape-determining protein MreD [Candidatus Schneideria nysicola]UAJ66154.1 rod shape-determining protein MreD [Candidatus Schneideria nysicola]
MNNQCCYYRCNGIVWISFFIAFILQIFPLWPSQLNLFKPSWINLILIYWIITIPSQFNIGIGFILGLAMDILLDITVGIQGIAMSLLTYLIILNIHFLQRISIYYQTLIIMLLLLITKIIIFLILYMISTMRFSSELFLEIIGDGLFWPVILYLMNKSLFFYIRRRIN